MKKLLKKILPSGVLSFLKSKRNNIRRRLQIRRIKAKIKSGLPLKSEIKKIRFEINIAEHCNLNCVGCMNFSCIAEPELVDIEEFRRDFQRMGEIFNHVCDRIYLIGGEPLLHPETITLMKIARENFTYGTIELFTNGILLTRQKDEFWQACHDNNIGITVTPYPIKLEIEKIKSLAERFDVKFQWAWGMKENSRDIFTKEAIILSGDRDARLNFALCIRGNNCITLSHGRLYTCPFAAHVVHFNRKFGQNIIITEEDYVDIYKNFSAEEIFRKMASPVPACRYCRKEELPEDVKWRPSRGEISEWV